MNKLNPLPRNGQYEIFTHGGKTYCFDDCGADMPLIVGAPKEMFDWIREQDKELWRPMRDDPDSNVALYLSLELYIMWKLKWT